jgi:beta-phosphoglucomutase-like phosphatase (HAD superfamily)
VIKTVFWDNDGVLIDTEKFYFEATRIVLSRFGVDLSRELYIKNYLIANRGCWHLLPGGLEDPDSAYLGK